MSVAAIVRAYHLTDFLPSVLESLEDIPVKLLVSGRWIGVASASDDAQEIAAKHGWNILAPGELPQHEVLNAAIKAVEHCSQALIIDADEIVLPDSIEAILAAHRERPNAAIACHVKDYWRTPAWAIDPMREHTPVVCVRPGQVRFSRSRCVAGHDGFVTAKALIHHLGFCFTDDDMLWKCSNRPDEIVPPTWYNDVWMRWKPGMRNLGMERPEDFAEAVPTDAPSDVWAAYTAGLTRRKTRLKRSG